MASYFIPANSYCTEIEIKRSRFICHIQHTKGHEAAKEFIQQIKNNYPDARHHCYGVIAYEPSNSNGYGFSDDNEPSGTAGMPIFTHLKHSSMGETTVVVVRYFGGTKLGTGGLARAYSEAAKKGLKEVTRIEHIQMKSVQIHCTFAMEDKVRKKIESLNGSVVTVDYQKKVILTASIPAEALLEMHHEVEVSTESTI